MVAHACGGGGLSSSSVWVGKGTLIREHYSTVCPWTVWVRRERAEQQRHANRLHAGIYFSPSARDCECHHHYLLDWCLNFPSVEDYGLDCKPQWTLSSPTLIFVGVFCLSNRSDSRTRISCVAFRFWLCKEAMCKFVHISAFDVLVPLTRSSLAALYGSSGFNFLRNYPVAS